MLDQLSLVYDLTTYFPNNHFKIKNRPPSQCYKRSPKRTSNFLVQALHSLFSQENFLSLNSKVYPIIAINRQFWDSSFKITYLQAVPPRSILILSAHLRFSHPLGFIIWFRRAKITSVILVSCDVPHIPSSTHFFILSKRPNQIWDPPSLIWNWYWWFFPWDVSGRSMKLTTHLHLVLSLRMSGAIPSHTLSWRAQGHFTFTCAWQC